MTELNLTGGHDKGIRLRASLNDDTGVVSGTLMLNYKDFVVSGLWGWSPERRNKRAGITLLGTSNDEDTIFITLSGTVDDDFRSMECVLVVSLTNENDKYKVLNSFFDRNSRVNSNNLFGYPMILTYQGYLMAGFF